MRGVIASLSATFAAPLSFGGEAMRRRDFIGGIVGSATAWPLAPRAQQPSSLPTIGYLAAISEAADRTRRAAYTREGL